MMSFSGRHIEFAGLFAIVAVALNGCGSSAPMPTDSDDDGGSSYFTATLAAIESGDYARPHSLLIHQRGELALERHWPGQDGWRGLREFGADDLHDLRSCSKSVTGLLVGIARSRGLLPDLATPAHTLFPDIDRTTLTERHLRITLEHLLLMTDGIAWDQNPAEGGVNNEAELESAKDGVAYVWSLPMAREPGETMNYNSGATALLAGAIARAYGKDIEAFAAESLFEPLGIADWEWMRDEDGTPGAHWGLRLSSRDTLKIGRLVLARGEWEGRQVVPAKWIDDSTDSKGGERRLGYHWWLGARPIGDRIVPTVDAAGKGGQMIHVFPEQDAVVVVTAGHYEEPEKARTWHKLLKYEIIPELLEE